MNAAPCLITYGDGSTSVVDTNTVARYRALYGEPTFGVGPIPRPRSRLITLTRINHLALRLGYVADGNLLFRAVDHGAIVRGSWRASVIETAHAYPASIVRLARCLSRLY